MTPTCLDRDCGRFEGRTREIILDLKKRTLRGGWDILLGAQIYLMFGGRTCGISSVERFEEKTLAYIRERELSQAYAEVNS
jgi:hypothetical protein